MQLAQENKHSILDIYVNAFTLVNVQPPYTHIFSGSAVIYQEEM